jgi:hypothetical protein
MSPKCLHFVGRGKLNKTGEFSGNPLRQNQDKKEDVKTQTQALYEQVHIKD